MKLTDRDRDALERAIEAYCAESDRQRERIDEQLARGENWETVAIYSLQMQAMSLLPWQSPPVFADVRPGREHYGHGEREATELLQRLRLAGVSRYEPDPLKALAAAERRITGARKPAPTSRQRPAAR